MTTARPTAAEISSADAPDALIDGVAQQLTRLGRLRDRTTAHIHALSNGEVEPASFAILFQLICHGPMRSGALAEALYSDASTISRQVATLVKRGLVQRRADPTDGRVSVIAVTEAGRAVADEIRRRRNASLRQVMADWQPGEREIFAALLRRFVDDYEHTRSALLATIFPNSDDANSEPAERHS
ncbi:MarR family winged helix-turn-helix transcriptional regulator [Nocardia sp. NPDC050406]|uniref:MarR family winged helix-turn-helix transcriptional regulator n=1 Tax=Nocardia sp. NPDC050406 TaxID=3364318 RepID=UPI0037A22033